MSRSIVHGIGESVRGAAVETVWAQWSALTGAAADARGRRVAAMVDPEALVLASLAFRGHERRLTDLVFATARSGTRLLSVQRAGTLAETYSAAAQEGLRAFAWAAAEAGDKRWSPHAAPPPADAQLPRPRRAGALRLLEGPALMLRLRTALGVGAKADVLAFLLGMHGAAVPLKDVALATGYGVRGIRRAVEEMAVGGFVQPAGENPAAFAADHRAWAAVLGMNEARPGRTAGVPPWRCWSLVFAFMAALDEWAAQSQAEGWSEYVASSRARDLVQDHAPRLRLPRIDLPDPREPTGAAYLEDLARAVKRLAAWCEKQL